MKYLSLFLYTAIGWAAYDFFVHGKLDASSIAMACGWLVCFVQFKFMGYLK